MDQDNARILRITAADGTELADPYAAGTITATRKVHVSPGQTQFKTRKAFLLHAAWLGQPSGHCPIFPTAATRR